MRIHRICLYLLALSGTLRQCKYFLAAEKTGKLYCWGEGEKGLLHNNTNSKENP